MYDLLKFYARRTPGLLLLGLLALLLWGQCGILFPPPKPPKFEVTVNYENSESIRVDQAALHIRLNIVNNHNSPLTVQQVRAGVFYEDEKLIAIPVDLNVRLQDKTTILECPLTFPLSASSPVEQQRLKKAIRALRFEIYYSPRKHPKYLGEYESSYIPLNRP